MLLNALAARFKGDPNPKSDAADTRVRVVDLNGDGVPEVISQASGDICSPTGNCPFWVFQKAGTQYRLILEKGAVQDFTIQPTQTSGYFDLVLGMHGSATEQGCFSTSSETGDIEERVAMMRTGRIWARMVSITTSNSHE